MQLLSIYYITIYILFIKIKFIIYIQKFTIVDIDYMYLHFVQEHGESFTFLN